MRRLSVWDWIVFGAGVFAPLVLWILCDRYWLWASFCTLFSAVMAMWRLVEKDKGKQVWGGLYSYSGSTSFKWVFPLALLNIWFIFAHLANLPAVVRIPPMAVAQDNYS